MRCPSFTSRLLQTVAAVCLATSALAQPDLPAPLSDTDFLWDGAPPAPLFDLGRNLFFDPILSGNRNISCGSCHDPRRGTGDGLALGIGEGGAGFGEKRHTAEPVTSRVPRNAPALYNIGARAFVAMFHDGRVQRTPDGGYISPLDTPLPEGLSSPLAAQAMFPVLSPTEMAGQKGENAIADAVFADRDEEAWQILADRLRDNARYAAMFIRAFPDINSADDITFVHAAEALAAFQTRAFRSTGSPFDAALAGADLPARAAAGAALFYGKARCATCHSGALLTDHDFHAIAVPQIGPGKNHGADTTYRRQARFGRRLEDEGRFDVTEDPDDLFRFRTPSLRNVSITGPWGHNGAFVTLEEMVRHHLDPVQSLRAYRAPALPEIGAVIELHDHGVRRHYRPVEGPRRDRFNLRDAWVQSQPVLRNRIEAANELPAIALEEAEIAQILAFLDSLTDPAARDQSHLIPATVPSGLPPQPTP